MNSPVLVHICIFIFNFLASIIQGLTGFGDAVLLHVLWYTACVSKPDVFLSTPLGENSVSAVALLMYVRIIFSAPLLAYMSLEDGVFSWSMTIAMVIPSFTCAVGGVFVFRSLQHGDTLKRILGVSSLIFAVLYAVIVAGKYVWRRKRVKALMEKTWRRRKNRDKRVQGALPTDDALAAVDAAAKGPSTSAAISSPVGGETRREGRLTGLCDAKAQDVLVEAPETDLAEEEVTAARSIGSANARLGRGPLTPNLKERTDKQNGEEVTVHDVAEEAEGEEDEPTVYLSLETGSPFYQSEAQHIPVTEEGPSVPVLTLARVSPTSTLTYTRVRVNRNLDANGKIKRSTKIAAAISAAFTGVMGSLTGVGAPPQIIFILLLDVPQYVILVNFCMQSIPSALARFVMACAMHLFHPDMVPIFVNALIAGYAGLFVGMRLGKLMGPTSYSTFVFSILMLASLIMITTSSALLVVATVLCTGVCVCTAWWERRCERTARIAAQRAVEASIPEAAEQQQSRQYVVPHSSSQTTLTSAALDANRPPPTSSVPQMTVACRARVSESERESESPGSRFSSSLSHSASSVSMASGRVRKADLNRPPSLFSTPTASPALTNPLGSAVTTAVKHPEPSYTAPTQQPPPQPVTSTRPGCKVGKLVSTVMIGSSKPLMEEEEEIVAQRYCPGTGEEDELPL